jgi:hypothetical protein
MNKLSELNDYLFMTIDRLGDKTLKGEELTQELDRARVITGLAGQIIANGNLSLKAHLASIEWESMSKKKLPQMLTD